MLIVLATFFFFFNDTATTEIYTLSLHDALPIYPHRVGVVMKAVDELLDVFVDDRVVRHLKDPRVQLRRGRQRSEEHTSELQSLRHLVCRLLLEKKKRNAANIKPW